jgi:hypothetical protein
MISLDYILHYGGMLVEMVALVATGLAAWSLSKLLKEKGFLIAAWAMGVALLLMGVLVVMNLLWVWLGAGSQIWWSRGYPVVQQLQAAAFLGFLVAFSIGAVRSGMRARKVVA